MPEFKVINSGTNKDGSFWTMIVKEENNFVMSSIVRTTKNLVKNDKIEIPKELASEIKWKL